MVRLRAIVSNHARRASTSRARYYRRSLNDLDNNLLEQDLPEEERRAIHRMALTAFECHTRGLLPPTEEVKFWM